VNANNKLLANFAEKTLEDGTKPKMEIWVVNLGEAFNVRRRPRDAKRVFVFVPRECTNAEGRPLAAASLHQHEREAA